MTSTTSTPQAKRGTALITGASSGFGAIFASQLAAKGYDLALVARRADRLHELAEALRVKHGVTVEVIVADLIRDEGIRVVEEYITRTKNLSLLVNNAGFNVTGRFTAVDIGRLLDIVQLHNATVVRLTHAALPGMIACGKGGVINVASVAGLVVLPYTAIYNATKSFLVMFSRALDSELAGTGVQVMATCPGFARTEIFDTPGFGNFEPTRIPGFMWLDAEFAVRSSLLALERGKSMHIPGWKYRALVVLLNLPGVQPFVRRVVGGSSRRRKTSATEISQKESAGYDR